MGTIVIASAGAPRAGELAALVRAAGHGCEEITHAELFTNRRAAAEVLSGGTPDCVVIVAPEVDGWAIAVVRTVRILHTNAGVLLVADAKPDRSRTALDAGADALLTNSINPDRFISSVEQLLNLAKVRVELQYLRRRDSSGAALGRLVAGSPKMRAVVAEINRLCRRTVRSRTPAVLITGETGTGKGQIARAIHYNGTRRDRSLVEVNCAALPDTLIEVELFGCEKGAFTGANTARPGLFEVAHGGTIFLDEIGALNIDLQAKLLRFLDDGAVRRLGSTEERTLDVQVIAATNRDLEAASRAAEFREDLFFRLSTIHLTLPALRDRDRDVIELARLFTEEICKDYGMPIKTLSRGAEEALMAYRWPGNIRELKNRLERVVLLRDIEQISAADLELPSEPGRVYVEDGKIRVELPVQGIDLAEVERAFIEQALERADGNVSRAARLLGMTRAALRYRLGR